MRIKSCPPWPPPPESCPLCIRFSDISQPTRSPLPGGKNQIKNGRRQLIESGLIKYRWKSRFFLAISALFNGLLAPNDMQTKAPARNRKVVGNYLNIKWKLQIFAYFIKFNIRMNVKISQINSLRRLFICAHSTPT